MLSFVTTDENPRIQNILSYIEVTAVFMLNNSHIHHISHSDEPLPYHVYMYVLYLIKVELKKVTNIQFNTVQIILIFRAD